jgi:benzoyl-CoA reductase/2-hydroxyglutaryl-CoA dehydratase subunit BcrC/BadD/HgdB
MTALVEKIASGGTSATRQQLRDAVAKPKAGRPKHYVFAYRPPTKAFNLKISFAKSRANRDEVIDALEAIIRDLKKSK